MGDPRVDARDVRPRPPAEALRQARELPPQLGVRVEVAARHEVVLERGLPEDLGQPSGSTPAEELHLAEPVLRDRVARTPPRSRVRPRGDGRNAEAVAPDCDTRPRVLRRRAAGAAPERLRLVLQALEEG